ASVAKEAGGTMTVKSFTRFEKGEGIEKRQEDFAAEIAKQLGK
ncbi:MAG: elongation factor Ts, partial [Pseudoflavonifractor sp.]